MSNYGTLYGVGVGPGDPELITLKAQKILEAVRYIFTPVTGKGKKSIAYTIAQRFISPDATIEPLVFPMTTERSVCEKAWEENTEKVMTVLAQGTDAAFITMGDPLTYSTYGYLLKTMRSRYPQVPSTTVPGIPAYLAMAASTTRALALGEEVLTLIPGNVSHERVAKLISLSDTIVFLKHTRGIRAIVQMVQAMGLGDRLTYVSRCGFEDQHLCSDPSPELLEKTGYLSLLMVKKS